MFSNVLSCLLVYAVHSPERTVKQQPSQSQRPHTKMPDFHTVSAQPQSAGCLVAANQTAPAKCRVIVLEVRLFCTATGCRLIKHSQPKTQPCV